MSVKLRIAHFTRKRLAALMDDRESEVRLKFDNLTINGDIAVAASFLKRKK